VTNTGSGPGGALARTGPSNPGLTLVIGLSLVMLGLIVLSAARRPD
jgi:LPXTG-motif cell wall-anchored protein